MTNCPKCNALAKKLGEDNVNFKAAFECYSCIMYDTDKFLQSKTCRVGELERAIAKHRSQKADDRCIFDDDALYEVLNDGIKCDRRVGCKEAMLENCKRFIENRCEEGGWKSYAELEAENTKLEEIIQDYKNRENSSSIIADDYCPFAPGKVSNRRIFGP